VQRLYRFDLSNLRGDLFGGITAGVVALPLALAFGVQSGLGAAAGIYGAMALGFFAAYLGGTPAQVGGPTDPMTVVSAGVAANIAAQAGGIAEGLGAVFLTFFLAGALQVVLGLVRVGKYIRYVPYPVVSGFMTGIGVIIILLQIFPMLGHRSPVAIIDVLLQIGKPLAAINFHALGLTILTYATIMVFPRITKKIPGSLFALFSVSLVAIGLGLDVPRIGDIPNGLPALHVEGMFDIDAHLWSTIASDAIALAVLGSIDSLLTSLVADNLTRTRHHSEDELIGQGIGNMASALIGGLPGAGATMRTVVNINAGGRTRISGMVHGLLLLAVLLGLGRYAEYVPLSVLAGILISVGVGIMDVKGIRQLRHVPRADAVVLVLVLFFTVFFDLIQAVALGVALASLLFMRQMGEESRLRSRVATFDDAADRAFGDASRALAPGEDERLPEALQGKIVVKHLHGPLHFGFTGALQDLAATIPKTPYLVIRMREVPYMDQSGLNTLIETISDLHVRGTEVFVTELQPQPANMLRESGTAPGMVPEANVMERFADVVPAISVREMGSIDTRVIQSAEAERSGVSPLRARGDVHEMLLARNREWSARMRQESPELFVELARRQKPFFLWIGCSDSRVPPNQITGTLPGDMFIHRNIANMVVHTDMNLLSVVDYGVNVLGIDHIIVCGHYGCGGVQAAMGEEFGGPASNWVRNIRDVMRWHHEELSQIADPQQRFDRLVEVNVAEQVYDLSRTSVIREAWSAGRAIQVHGWVYALSDGLIKDLQLTRTCYEEESSGVKLRAR
jgi:sulfate permease, SulP family